MCAARWLAAKLVGVAARNLSAAAAESLLGQLQEGMLPKSATRAHKFEERTGAMLASGVLLAQAATGALHAHTSDCCPGGLPIAVRHCQGQHVTACGGARSAAG